MRYPVVSWLAILAAALFCGGCELAEIGEPVVVSNIEKEFNIDLWEKLGPQQRTLQLQVSTIREEPCQNAKIDYAISQVNNKIQVSLRDIIAPADCNPGQSPARAVIELGSIPPGLYELNIDLKSKVFNNGQLAVYGDRYVVDMRSRNGFGFVNSELRRVPEQIIWGYITYQEATDEDISRKFLQDLQSIGQPRAFHPGNYGYFQILQDSLKVAVAGHPQTTRIGQFIYGFAGGRQSVQELLDSYRNKYPGRINIRLYTSTGEEW